ncbi:MAG: ATP-dependent helicase [Patescibacteria group bacterium]|nr:ATP-dependent helicase [Patescibacteria group bacterium]
MFLNGLNSQQEKIVENGDGVFVVKAGPGTGKTKTLVSRIAFLLLEKKVLPKNILALTFTKKAAAEMQDRLKQLCPGDLPKVTTFHGFGYDFLKNPGEEIKIIEEKQQKEIIEEILKSNQSKITVKESLLMLTKYKNSFSVPARSEATRQSQRGSNSTTGLLRPDVTSGLAMTSETLISLYQKKLEEKNLLDYDDLLIKVYNFLKDNPQKAKELQNQYHYLLVDEFQDTNPLQYQIIKEILNEDQNLFVIGDPRQAIYGFRGASSLIFDQLKTDFQKANEETLEVNYRSFSAIVETSNLLFPSVKLKAHHSALGKVILINTLDEYAEADFVIRVIEEKIGGSDLNKAQNTEDTSARLSDFAIIYRTHNLNKILQKKLNESGLPFQVAGEGSFYEEKNVALIIETLQSKKDEFGTEPLCQVVEKIIKEKEILQNEAVLQLLGNLVQFNSLKNGIANFLNYIEKIKAYDFYDQKCDKITLLTMHAAKGLEFKFVFILGFEQGIIPLVRKNTEKFITESTEADEEKRLFYVALTRAKEELYLLQTKARQQKATIPSPFLNLITSPLLSFKEDEAIEKIIKKFSLQKIKKRQTKLF